MFLLLSRTPRGKIIEWPPPPILIVGCVSVSEFKKISDFRVRGVSPRREMTGKILLMRAAMQSGMPSHIIMPGASATQTLVEENNQDDFYRADFRESLRHEDPGKHADNTSSTI